MIDLASILDDNAVSLSLSSSPQTPLPQDVPPPSHFRYLPAELRLKIWTCAVEPQVVILDDVFQKSRSYPLPTATQLNFEARTLSRQGYESIGRGSYFNFARDILVCDPNISDYGPSTALADLAPRIQRLAFWDCFPDDGRVLDPHHYSAYVTACYRQRHFGEVEFDKFLFPNLRDLWIIKIGEVDRSWRLAVDDAQPHQVRVRKTARQFRYWVDESIIEIAPLDLDDPDTKAVLREGRCGKKDCQDLNQSRAKTISKIMFIDGKYRKMDAKESWARILPWSVNPERGKEQDTTENRMRWIMVERALTFSLRFEAEEEAEGIAMRRQINRVPEPEYGLAGSG